MVIGNEAIWTKTPRQQIGLLGMDLIRLGLDARNRGKPWT